MSKLGLTLTGALLTAVIAVVAVMIAKKIPALQDKL